MLLFDSGQWISMVECSCQFEYDSKCLGYNCLCVFPQEIHHEASTRLAMMLIYYMCKAIVNFQMPNGLRWTNSGTSNMFVKTSALQGTNIPDLIYLTRGKETSWTQNCRLVGDMFVPRRVIISKPYKKGNLSAAPPKCHPPQEIRP